MLVLGAHESTAGGIHNALDRARSAGCDAVQFFVKSNRTWRTNPLTERNIADFKAKALEIGIRPLVAHSSYLINLASPDESLVARSCEALVVELERCEALGVPFLVLHPGSHVGTGEETGLTRVVEALKRVHTATPGLHVEILLETTAGQGSSLGHKFEQLAWLVEHSESAHLGICLDTCHVFAAGYELRTPEGYDATITAFDSTLGLDRLKALHLNDSKGALGSRKDRHEHVGRGHIGLDGFRNILTDARLAGLPGLLETPKSEDLHEDRENLALLRSLAT